MRAPARALALAVLAAGLLAAPLAPSAAVGGSGAPAGTTGRLLATVTDDFGAGRTATHLAVRPDGAPAGTVVPVLGVDPAAVADLVGRRVTVRGREARGGGIAADAADVQAATSSAGPSGTGTGGAVEPVVTAPTGPRRLSVLAVVVRFADEPAADVDAAATVAGRLFSGSTSVDAFYRDVSDGLWSLTGRAIGPYPTSLRSGTTCSVDDWYAWESAAEDAARAHGIDPDAYDHLAVVVPWDSTTGCGNIAGLGEVPGRVTWIRQVSLRVLAHELGHNLGAGHASTMRCTDGGRTVPIAPSGQCTVANPYGDPFSVMGSTTRLHHSATRQQYRLISARTLESGEATTVHLVPADTISGVREVRVDRGDGSWLAVEYRQPTGVFDAFATGEPVVTGVTLRLETGLTDDTYLVDVHPGTSSAVDAPLQVGESVQDPVSGSRVTLDAADARSATVTVSSAGAVGGLVVTRAGTRATAWWEPPTGLAGPLTYEVAVDHGTPVATNDTRWSGPLAPGRHTVSVRAVDADGARHPWSSRTLVVRAPVG